MSGGPNDMKDITAMVKKGLADEKKHPISRRRTLQDLLAVNAKLTAELEELRHKLKCKHCGHEYGACGR